jgi:4-hydroxyphenylpyruvate dioxygenase-like putative hemolysin
MEPTEFKDENGVIEIAKIKPPYGTWQHTLINSKKYSGFLPGYKTIIQKKTFFNLETNGKSKYLQNIDHIAIALEKGKFSTVKNFYYDAFCTF